MYATSVETRYTIGLGRLVIKQVQYNLAIEHFTGIESINKTEY